MRSAPVAALIILARLPVPLPAQISNIVVTNAASFQVGVPAPGSIGTIFCTGLSVTGVVSAPGTPLPTTLAGATVTVGGVPAFLFAVADLGGYQQINFQVPYGIQYGSATSGAVLVNIVVTQSASRGTVTATPADEIGAFFRSGSTQYGIFQHGADYSLVTTESPAKAGETIIGYATGIEPPSPSVPAGQATPDSPLYWVPQTSEFLTVDLHTLYIAGGGVTFGAATGAGLLFMGLAPGMVGVYQVNFVMPNVESGVATVTLGQTTCVPNVIDACQNPNSIVFAKGQSTVLIPVQ